MLSLFPLFAVEINSYSCFKCKSSLLTFTSSELLGQVYKMIVILRKNILSVVHLINSAGLFMFPH